MKLSLKNIAGVGKATIELNGITVIAGENNTGKSTVGKALYSVFNSFYFIEKQIRLQRIQSIENLLFISTNNIDGISGIWIGRINAKNIAEEMVNSNDVNKLNITTVKEILLEKYYVASANMHDSETLAQGVLNILDISNEEIFKTVLNNKLNIEFNGQINNLFSDEEGSIDLYIKEKEILIGVHENSVVRINNSVNLRTEVVYFDDPFVLDQTGSLETEYPQYSTGHKAHLRSKLFAARKYTNVIDEIVVNKKFKNIYEKINTICNGEMVREMGSSWGYKKANTDKVFDIKNISTGLKTFVILKTLLLNGTIEQNGIIILDEPEIHLHPEWQLLFAELIVLIQKEFGMHILLNTHSPYFLRAIQVYSAKYEVADKCKYYLSTLNEGQYMMDDVTEDIDKIYKKLSHPLQQLEDERWQDG